MAGDNLLVEFPIFAVADVLEAMASHPPYRPDLGLDSELGELSKNKCSHYDAEVVNACLRLFNDKGYKSAD